MPVRLEMLLSDQIPAAVMPEPFLTSAKLRGATVLVSSDDSTMEAGVMAFLPSTIERMAPQFSVFTAPIGRQHKRSMPIQMRIVTCSSNL